MLVTFAAALALPQQAHADAGVSLVPGPDGSLSAWLVAGPVHAGAAPKVGEVTAAREGERVAGAAWRVLHDASTTIDAGKSLGGARGSVAFVGGTLDLKSDLDGWLLVGVDGAVSVSLDGTLLGERADASWRGRARDVFPIKTKAGRHDLMLRLEHPGRHWALSLALVERDRLLPPVGARLRLPGTDEADARRLALGMLEARVSARITPRGLVPELALSYPGGMPEPAGAVSFELSGAGPARSWNAGALAADARGAYGLDATLPAIDPATVDGGTITAEVTAVVSAGGTEVRAKRTIHIADEAINTAQRARERANELAAGTRDTAVIRATLRHHAASIAGAAIGRRPDPSRAARAADAARAILKDLGAGRDPLDRAGVFDVVLPGTNDGGSQLVRVHAPRRTGADAARRYPLVVALHGMNGSPRGIMDAFLDSPSTAPRLPGYVVAPHAHGNAFYRGAGESAVLAAAAWAQRTYPIDPNRVSLTGVSMGGTGTGHVALRTPELWSRASPLCGYHSFFVRRDTSGRPLRAWEVARMHHWSPASWVANGRHLPLYVAHGKKDHPLDNSRVLIDAYRDHGYSIRDEWPDTGHAVWEQVWQGARGWHWLAAGQRVNEPTRVTIETDALRYGRRHWVRITELATRGRAGFVDADASGARVVIRTRNVAGLELQLPPGHDASAPLVVQLDDATIRIPAGAPAKLAWRDERWQRAETAATGKVKRAGVEGPIRDVFLHRLVFAYGTADPALTRAARDVARAFADGGPNTDVDYPVVADTQLTDELLRNASVFFVGPPRGRRARALLSGLPISISGGSVQLGSRTLRGDDLGAALIHPRPDQPESYVVAIVAPTVAGLWRAPSLPRLLPDFIVWDRGLRPAGGQQVLGEARVLAAGFFDHHWRLPSESRDVVVAPERAQLSAKQRAW